MGVIGGLDMGTIIRLVFGIIAVFIAGIVLFNASFLSGAHDGEIKILSHRGVHQTFYREGLTNETCTAERIHPVTHNYIENTLPSIKRAFELGANMVEIDVRRTADNHFAVFHDHMLDCRTDGSGMISDARMEDLRDLDLGYGYTPDHGRSYPLRGKGKGLMMSLDELLTAMPDEAFLINIKSNSAEDADAFFKFLEATSLTLNDHIRLWAGPKFAARSRIIEPEIKVGTRRSVKDCAKSYVSWGWLGHVPETCHQYGLIVPQNYTWLYWGWPRKTEQRFDRLGIPVLLVGPIGGEHEGIETLEQVDAIPQTYRGWVMTNKIEVVGPALKPNE